MGLSECKMCKALRKALDESDVPHKFSDCDHDPENCDALESLTGTAMYPMVLISDLEDNILEVAYIASDYEDLKESVKTAQGIKLVANYSIDGLLRYTVNRLHLNI